MLPLAWIDEVAKVCKELKLPLHCDGARLFNSAAALNVPASELVKHCDSVSVCLSKGLGKTQWDEVKSNKSVGTVLFISESPRPRL